MGRAPFNEAEELLAIHLCELGLQFAREYRFHPLRDWRADFIVATPGRRYFLIEIEGGIWTQGRHTRGKGYADDLKKYRAAVSMGFPVLRFSTEEVLTGQAKDFLGEHICKSAKPFSSRQYALCSLESREPTASASTKSLKN